MSESQQEIQKPDVCREGRKLYVTPQLDVYNLTGIEFYNALSLTTKIYINFASKRKIRIWISSFDDDESSLSGKSLEFFTD